MKKNLTLLVTIALTSFYFSIAWAQDETSKQKNENTYQLLNLFGDVFERVRATYVEEITDEQLIESAITGMLTSLDPHSSYLNAKNFKDCGAAFGQYLDRHPYWDEVLKAEITGLKPYSLRHGFAWRAAKYYPKPLSLRDTADLMGHDMRTHIRHYGQWTDEAGTEAAV